MIEKYSTFKVNNKILEIRSNLTFIREKVAELIDNPQPEVAEEIQELIKSLDSNSDSLKASIVTLAKEISGTDVDEDGKIVDGVQEENGIRLI